MASLRGKVSPNRDAVYHENWPNAPTWVTLEETKNKTYGRKEIRKREETTVFHVSEASQYERGDIFPASDRKQAARLCQTSNRRNSPFVGKEGGLEKKRTRRPRKEPRQILQKANSRGQENQCPLKEGRKEGTTQEKIGFGDSI